MDFILAGLAFAGFILVLVVCHFISEYLEKRKEKKLDKWPIIVLIILLLIIFNKPITAVLGFIAKNMGE
jgi:hypothetical protein